MQYSELDNIDIFERYPLLKPFIGEHFAKAKKRILFIGESHYLPAKFNNENTISTKWYSKRLSDYLFDEEAQRWLSTSTIIQEDVIEGDQWVGSHSIYRNLGNVYADVFGQSGYRESLKQISFYNYFLRPAEKEGESIRIKDWDEEVHSFQVLNSIQEILKPDLIVFASSKAKNSFHRVRWADEYREVGERLEAIIEQVPHPTRSWWNRSMKKYDGRTGKEHLMKVLQDLVISK